MDRNISELLKKLQNLARDQKGTPEGDLAEETIKRIKEKYPELADFSEISTVQWVNVFKNEFEYNLWFYSCKAHNIRIVKYNKYNNLELISEGNEVEMIIARSEWEFSVKQFNEMVIQVIRGIVNKFWPQICKSPDDIYGYVESPYVELAKTVSNITVTPKKALKGEQIL